MVMDSPLKEFGKKYFRQLLSHTHENIRFGDELNVGIMFYNDGGKVSNKFMETINKNELDENSK